MAYGFHTTNSPHTSWVARWAPAMSRAIFTAPRIPQAAAISTKAAANVVEGMMGEKTARIASCGSARGA